MNLTVHMLHKCVVTAQGPHLLPDRSFVAQEHFELCVPVKRMAADKQMLPFLCCANR